MVCWTVNVQIQGQRDNEVKYENMDLIQLSWVSDPAAGRVTWSLAALVVISVGDSCDKHTQTELIIN